MLTHTENRFFRFVVVAGVNIAVVFGMLLLLEVCVRVFCPDIKPLGTSRDLALDGRFGNSPGLRPLTTGTCDGTQVAVDALGFWKYSTETRGDVDSWLFLGDSVTMGIGIEPDSTFSGRIAAVLRQSRILNPSWIGYSSADYVAVVSALLLRNAIPELKSGIHHVTIFWTLNDVYSNYDIGLLPGAQVREFGAGFYTFIKKHYRTYEWLKNMFFDRPKEYFEFDRKFYHQGDPHFTAAVADLDSIRKICAATGTRLEVVLMPYEYQLRSKNMSLLEPQKVLSHALDSLDIRHYDATPTLAAPGQDIRLLFRYGDGIHFSSRGHEVMSKYIREMLIDR
jgi:lysophospholipase L1-like esterase